MALLRAPLDRGNIYGGCANVAGVVRARESNRIYSIGLYRVALYITIWWLCNVAEPILVGQVR